jgi:hypothetical protein
MSSPIVRMNPALQLRLLGFDFDIKLGQACYELQLMRDYEIVARVSALRSGGPMPINEVRKRARIGRFGETSAVHQCLEQFVAVARDIRTAEAAAKEAV